MALADTFFKPSPIPLSMLEPTLIAELALLGLCTGFLAGLLGIGGGMLMGPFPTLILSHRGLSADLAVKVRTEHGRASMVTASNCFAHVNDLREARRAPLVG